MITWIIVERLAWTAHRGYVDLHSRHPSFVKVLLQDGFFFFYLHDMTASFVFSCSLQATWFTVLRTMTSLTTDGPPRSPVGHTWLWRTSNPTPGDSLNNSRHMFITHNLKVVNFYIHNTARERFNWSHDSSSSPRCCCLTVVLFCWHLLGGFI